MTELSSIYFTESMMISREMKVLLFTESALGIAANEYTLVLTLSDLENPKMALCQEGGRY